MKAPKTFIFAAALACGGLGAVGCTESSERSGATGETVQSEARELGREAGEATRSAGEKLQEAVDGFREGVGGSGDAAKDNAEVDARPDHPDVELHPGNNPGVINDGEGPIEERTEPSSRRP